MSEDPYLNPHSDVLHNELGIRDAEQLRRVESDLTYWRAIRLAARPLPGRYDLDHLRAYHHALFEGIYAWAGKPRTVALAKTDLFCLPEHINSYATDVFGRLARERHLRDLGRGEFVDRLGSYFGDVNALHPFREGNGRAQRVLFGQLAQQAGYQLDWQRVDPQRNIQASIASMRGDQRPLREMLAEVTEPITAERPATARALQAAYAERDRLQQERAQLPDVPAGRRDRTRRFAYDAALRRAATTIAELEDANGGPLTAQQTASLRREDQARTRHRSEPGRDRDAGRQRELPDGPDLERGRD